MVFAYLFLNNRGKIFLFSAASRPALGSNQSPIKWAPEALSAGIKYRRVKLTTYLHLVPRSRMVELYLHSPYVFMPKCLIN
jgi:hypothetical protein